MLIRSVATPDVEAQFRDAVINQSERRDPRGCVAQDAILATATRDPRDCVVAKGRSGNSTPSEVMLRPEGSDAGSRGSGQDLQQDGSAVRPAGLPTALAVTSDGGKPPTPPNSTVKPFLIKPED